MSERERGVYYTAGNPFDNPAFRSWARRAGLPRRRILEPFAGGNALIDTLGDMGFCEAADSFDIAPAAAGVKKRDTLSHFPEGYAVCVTNPPWLAKNSATRRGLAFPETPHDDLYKMALGSCLDHCRWVCALIPESFLQANLFRKRLTDFISLTCGAMFDGTDHPVGLALFQPAAADDARIWRDETPIGLLSDLEKEKPSDDAGIDIRFNVPDGNVGLIAVDDTRRASIRFCDPSELDGYRVRPSCRSITKLAVGGAVRINAWNEWLNDFRERTHDVFLTSFKGLRKDGRYRRRLDWKLAREIINYVAR